MQARRIIEGAAFGPETLRTAREAFETAWWEISVRFEPTLHEEVREHLATAIISATRTDRAQVDVLRDAGLRAIARVYPAQLAKLPVDDTELVGRPLSQWAP